MSIVQLDLPGARVLDLFAGSGALGLEALSRGARRADFVEKDPQEHARARRRTSRPWARATAPTVHRKSALPFAESAWARSITTSHSPIRLMPAARPPKLAERWLKAPFSRVLGIEHSATDANCPRAASTRKYGSTRNHLLPQRGMTW